MRYDRRTETLIISGTAREHDEVTEVIANSGVHAVFAKTSQRKFALRAISEEDMVDWICVLKTGAAAT